MACYLYAFLGGLDRRAAAMMACAVRRPSIAHGKMVFWNGRRSSLEAILRPEAFARRGARVCREGRRIWTAARRRLARAADLGQGPGEKAWGPEGPFWRITSRPWRAASRPNTMMSAQALPLRRFVPWRDAGHFTRGPETGITLPSAVRASAFSLTAHAAHRAWRGWTAAWTTQHLPCSCRETRSGG